MNAKLQEARELIRKQSEHIRETEALVKELGEALYIYAPAQLNSPEYGLTFSCEGCGNVFPNGETTRASFPHKRCCHYVDLMQQAGIESKQKAEQGSGKADGQFYFDNDPYLGRMPKGF